MGNGINAFDFSVPLATFLASAISDGTYDDLLTALKFDKTGQEAVATDIVSAAGQLLSNLRDDYILATYGRFHLSTKVWRVADAAARDALGTDNSLAVDDIAYTEDTHRFWYATAVTGAATSTWATLDPTLTRVLTAGNATGGVDLQLTAGDDLLVGTSGTLADPGGSARISGVASASMNGARLDVQDGTSGGLGALMGGNAISGGLAGGDAALTAGNGDGAGNGGDVPLTPGTTGSGTVGAIQAIGALAITVVVSDTISSANENDYDPGGTWPATNVLRITPNAGGTTVTGIESTGAPDSVLVLLVNPSSADALTLVHESASSNATNRIVGESNANVMVRTNGSVWLWYDGTSSRWRTR